MSHTAGMSVPGGRASLLAEASSGSVGQWLASSRCSVSTDGTKTLSQQCSYSIPPFLPPPPMFDLPESHPHSHLLPLLSSSSENLSSMSQRGVTRALPVLITNPERLPRGPVPIPPVLAAGGWGRCLYGTGGVLTHAGHVLCTGWRHSGQTPPC